MKLTTASEVPQCSGKRSGKMKAIAASSTRLVAVTAAGPVYEGVVPGVRVPLPSFLALLQELAARADNPRSEVVSSMAQRVHGTDAHEMWNYLGAGFGLRLSQAAPATRVAALREIFAYVRRSGGAAGVESPLTAAVNAAWPFLTRRQLHSTLEFAAQMIARSTFVDRHRLIVVDPNARTFSDVAAGQLAAVDPIPWLRWAEATIPEWRAGLPKNDWGTDQFGSAEGALGKLGGDPGSTRPGADWGGGGGPTGSGLPGRPGAGDGTSQGTLPGYGGAGISGGFGLGGFGGHGNGSREDDGFGLFGDGTDLGDSIGGWGGGGLPGYGGAGTSGGFGLGGFGGRTGGFEGPFGRYSVGNIGGSGGPLGFGAQLGADGASDWFSTAEKAVGGFLIVMGTAGVAVGTATMPEGAQAVGIGGLDVTLGVWLSQDADRREDKAQHDQERAEDQAQHQKERDEDKKAAEQQQKNGQIPTVTPDQLPNVPPPTVTPDQLPDAPKQGDSYPDPHPHNGSQLPSGDGTVDPVDPRMLPSEDGAVAPVDPRMLPAGDGTVGPLDPRMLPADELGHGGNPTTIWEENGGGVTPTTLGRRATLRTIGGRGLIGGIAQVSPRAFTY